MGSGSNSATIWQFKRETWSTWGPYTDCGNASDTPVLSKGESLTNYSFGVEYNSTERPNGTHTSHGRISAKPLPYGSYSQLDYKEADYTVSN